MIIVLGLSPLLFIIIMDVLTENIEKDPPWEMMFADDLVLCTGCTTTREEVEKDMDTWRVVFESHGLKSTCRARAPHMIQTPQ